MIWLDINGRQKNVAITKYLIDWKRKVSAPQLAVKQFLYPYWKSDIVLEEWRIPSSLMRIDLINCNRKIAIEVSPTSTHATYNPFFHGSVAGYRSSIKRDLRKEEWITKNGYQYVEITDTATQLSAAWFKDTYDIDL